jgi:nucleoside-diphosphate-sugar epimerase
MIGVDYVYHCAALVSFDASDFKKLIEANVEGTANVVNACAENDIRKLCYVSSIASLGQAEKGEFIDEDAKWKTSGTNSGYSISKYGGEREVWRGIEEGLNAVIVNPSIIIGAGCHKRAVNPLFRNIRKLLPFYTSGTKGYVDVRDVVKAMILLMESDISGERFVLNSENLSMREFMTKVARLINKPDPWLGVNNNLLFTVAWLDELRGKLTGVRPVFTKSGIRAAISKSHYSADKFKSAFQYTFIPIEESLKEAFRIMDATK